MAKLGDDVGKGEVEVVEGPWIGLWAHETVKLSHEPRVIDDRWLRPLKT